MLVEQLELPSIAASMLTTGELSSHSRKRCFDGNCKNADNCDCTVVNLPTLGFGLSPSSAQLSSCELPSVASRILLGVSLANSWITLLAKNPCLVLTLSSHLSPDLLHWTKGLIGTLDKDSRSGTGTYHLSSPRSHYNERKLILADKTKYKESNKNNLEARN